MRMNCTHSGFTLPTYQNEIQRLISHPTTQPRAWLINTKIKVLFSGISEGNTCRTELIMFHNWDFVLLRISRYQDERSTVLITSPNLYRQLVGSCVTEVEQLYSFSSIALTSRWSHSLRPKIHDPNVAVPCAPVRVTWPARGSLHLLETGIEVKRGPLHRSPGLILQLRKPPEFLSQEN